MIIPIQLELTLTTPWKPSNNNCLPSWWSFSRNSLSSDQRASGTIAKPHFNLIRHSYTSSSRMWNYPCSQLHREDGNFVIGEAALVDVRCTGKLFRGLCDRRAFGATMELDTHDLWKMLELSHIWSLDLFFFFNLQTMTKDVVGMSLWWPVLENIRGRFLVLRLVHIEGHGSQLGPTRAFGLNASRIQRIHLEVLSWT